MRVCPSNDGSPRPVRRAAMMAAVVTALLLIGPTTSSPQVPGTPSLQSSGPVIQSAGRSFLVDDPTFGVPAGHVFKGVFEINAGGDFQGSVNEQLGTVARFYNLHVRHGVPEKRVQAAAVFHGMGWTALLTDAAFAKRYGGKPNPSRRLTEELLEHGAQLILCGQTAGARGIGREELIPGVKVAISAMTALNVLQSQGYQFNPW
jgi:intracellular sulfur oxidation DsrE/DsrF family protein